MRNILLSMGIVICLAFPQKSYAELDGLAKFLIGAVVVAGVAGAISRNNDKKSIGDSSKWSPEERCHQNCNSEFGVLSDNHRPASHDACHDRCRNQYSNY